MLNKVWADDKRFNTIEFKGGFNIILGQRAKNADNSKSCNGLGKTLLINIIKFCLGNKFDKNSPLAKEAIKSYTYYLSLTIKELEITVSRSAANPSKVCVNTNQPIVGLPLDEKNSCSVDSWVEFLEKEYFHLEQKYTEVTCHSLLNYFIKTDASSALSNFSKQKAVSIQFNSAYLLGLDMGVMQKSYDTRQVLKNLKDRKKTYSRETKGLLENQKRTLQRKVEEMQNQLTSCDINTQYREIENQANLLTSQTKDMRNEKTLLKEEVSAYNKAKQEETIDQEKLIKRLQNVYDEVGVALPDNALKTLNQAKEFHEAIIRDRHQFIETELQRLKKKIGEIDDELRNLDQQKRQYLTILQASTTQEEYENLEQLLEEKKKELNRVEARIEDLNQLQKDINSLSAEKANIDNDIQTDLKSHEEFRNYLINTFHDFTNKLYEHQGDLSIEFSDDAKNMTGYKFQVSPPKGSDGQEKSFSVAYDILLQAKRTKDNIGAGKAYFY